MLQRRIFRLFVVITLTLMVAAGCPQPAAVAKQDTDTLRVQLIWHHESEFVGYYAAQTKDFYEDQELQVELLPGGPGIKPLKRLTNGKADIAIAWLPQALALRKRGINLVNIAQIHQKSQMALACLKSAGIEKPADIRGKTISTWGLGAKASVLSLLNQLNIPQKAARLVEQNGAEPTGLINGRYQCSTVTLYNEYPWLLQNGFKPDDILLVPFHKYASDFLGNGLYVLGDRLRDSKFVNRLGRFISATAAGWDYTRQHRSEAMAMAMARGNNLNYKLQKRMLHYTLKSIGTGPFGYLHLKDYHRNVNMLTLNNNNNEFEIRATARRAWTHRIWNRAKLDQRDNQSLTRTTAHKLAQIAGSLWFHIFDLIGTATFAIAGFMRARKHRYDLFGAFVLTLLPAVGGGTLRDVLIGGPRQPLFIFSDPAYIFIVCGVVVLGSILTSILPEDISRTSGFQKRMLIFDTAGLSTFSILGAEVALLAGLPWFWAAICSALTCTGGGVLLDVITGHEPRTFQGEIYEELGIVGGLLLFFGLQIANYFEHASWLVPFVILFTFAIVFTLRILVVKRHWRFWRLGSSSH